MRKKRARKVYSGNRGREVSEHIKKGGIEAKIDGRIKHFFKILKDEEPD